MCVHHSKTNTVVFVLSAIFIFNCFIQAKTDLTISQITNDSYEDWNQRISNTHMVWQGSDGSDGEILLYDIDLATTVNICNSDHSDDHPQISGSTVTWEGWSGDLQEIFFYDGYGFNQLTDNGYEDKRFQIYGNPVVWWGYDGIDWEIDLYNGETTIQLTDNSHDDMWPRIYTHFFGLVIHRRTDITKAAAYIATDVFFVYKMNRLQSRRLI